MKLVRIPPCSEEEEEEWPHHHHHHHHHQHQSGPTQESPASIPPLNLCVHCRGPLGSSSSSAMSFNATNFRPPMETDHLSDDAPLETLCPLCHALNALVRSLTQSWQTRGQSRRSLSNSGRQCRLCFEAVRLASPGLCRSCQSRLGECQDRFSEVRALLSRHAPLSCSSSSLGDYLGRCRVLVVKTSSAPAIPAPSSNPFSTSQSPDSGVKLFVLAEEYQSLRNEEGRRRWLSESGRPVGFKLNRGPDGRLDIFTGGAYAVAQNQSVSASSKPRAIICVICTREFPDLFSGIEHTLEHDVSLGESTKPKGQSVKIDSGQSCELCGKMFFKPSQLQNHMRVHRGEKPFQCELCLKGFTRKASYQEHRARHDGIKDKECHICQKKFYATSFFRHMATVHPESDKLKYACPVCGKLFALKYKLQIHEKTHVTYDQREFECENCPEKRFATKSQLMNHMNQVHSLNGQSNPLLCQDCGMSFNAKSGLMAHRARHHLNPEQNTHVCSFCPLRFQSMKMLKKHVDIVHPQNVPDPENKALNIPGTNEIELLLPVVDPTWTQGQDQNLADLTNDSAINPTSAKTNLTDSLLVEENGLQKILLRTNEGDFLVPLEFKEQVKGDEIDPQDLDLYLCGTEQQILGMPEEFPCEECGKPFRSQKAKSQHIRNVHSQATFCCSQCSKTFSTLQYLKVHEKVHTTLKQISCQVCQKLFKFEKDLVKHMRIHTGEKPYRCLDCGKSFANTSNLAEHRTLHTGKLNYACPKCNQRFRIWSSMNKHHLRGQCSTTAIAEESTNPLN